MLFDLGPGNRDLPGNSIPQSLIHNIVMITALMFAAVLAPAQGGLLSSSNQVRKVEKAKLVLSLNQAPSKTGIFSGTAKVTFPKGWHGSTNPPADKYDTPLTLTVGTQGYTMSKVTYPKGNSKVGKKPVYSGEIEIKFELKPSKIAPPTTAIEFALKYQMCSETTCIPPTTINATVKLGPKDVKN